MVLVAAVETESGPRTYGNWRKPTSPGLLGLGSVGTALLLASLIILILMITIAGLLPALIAFVVLAVVMAAVVVKDKHGMNTLSRTGAKWGFRMAKWRGKNIYRSGPLGRAHWGTYQLPGLAAPMRLSEHRDSYDRPFALIYTPRQSTYTVVFGTSPAGASLVDVEQVDYWVADWGHWLANLGNEPGVVAASVTLETAPDTGTALRREVEWNIDSDAPAYARAVMLDTVEEYPSGSAKVDAYVAVTFSAAARSGGKRRTPEEMGRELAARLPALSQNLQATGAGAARALTAQDLCELVRVAYDPAIAVLIDEAHMQGNTPELSWSDVGPSAHQASWDGYRHDSAYSTTWAMTGAPRGHVQSGVLRRLLQPHRDIARKRVTLTYQAVDPGRAAAIVEADRNAAAFKVTGNAKATQRDIDAVKATAASASEESAGAGLVEFGMLVTATVTDSSMIADAHAAIDNLGASARLLLRPAYGSQDSAFAAALPLGLVLPKHLMVPAAFREKL